MERVAAPLKSKIMSAEEAAQLVKSGMSIGLSGFTSVGYPKAVPSALAASGHAKDLTILVGAAVGDDCDGALVRAGKAIDCVLSSMDAGMTPDAVLLDVESAMQALGEVTGRVVREDITNEIFSRFCVGK